MGESVPPLLGRICITYEDKAHADSWAADAHASVLMEQQNVYRPVNPLTAHAECHHHLPHLILIEPSEVMAQDNAPFACNVQVIGLHRLSDEHFPMDRDTSVAHLRRETREHISAVSIGITYRFLNVA